MEDTMDYEISTLTDMMKYANKHEWQQARLIIYTLMAPNMKKKKEITDILPLPFDDKFTRKKTGPLAGKQKDMMDSIAAKINSMIKNKEISLDGKQ